MKELLLGLMGIGAGVFTAAGAVTVVTVVGMIPRFAARTGTANRLRLYENCVFGGIVFGNAVSMYFTVLERKIAEESGNSLIGRILSDLCRGYLALIARVPFISVCLLLFYGIVTGIYVGCIALSIAEMVDAIPIFTRRIKMKSAVVISTLILGIAVGKMLGAYFYFFTAG